MLEIIKKRLSIDNHSVIYCQEKEKNIFNFCLFSDCSCSASLTDNKLETSKVSKIVVTNVPFVLSSYAVNLLGTIEVFEKITFSVSLNTVRENSICKTGKVLKTCDSVALYSVVANLYRRAL